MAYKFQLGKAKLSGSIETAQGITSQGGLLVNGDVDLDAGVINNAELQNSSVRFNGVTVALGATGSFGTDAVSEGSTNKYYLDSRARAAISVTDVSGDGSLTYDSGSGVITYTGPSAAEVRARISAVDAGGDGSFSYDSATGAFTYTGPSSAEARAHFSANDAGGDGSFSYNSTTGVFTYTGPSATEARAHFSAVDAGGDGSFAYDSATGAFTYTGPSATEVRAHLSAAVSGGLTYNSTNGKFALDSHAAGVGLSLATGSLNVNVDASSIEIDADILRVKAAGVTNAMLAGSIENGKLVNSSVTVTAGNGLTDGGLVSLGGSVSLNVAAASANAIVVTADGIDLKSTISGDRSFTGNVTINNLNVTGTLTTINTTNLEVVDARILIASGSSAFTASQGVDFGGYAQLITAVDADVGNALSSSLPMVMPSIKAGAFYGSFVGSTILSIVTVSTATGTISANVTRANAASQTLTLPSLPATGQEHRIKCVVADASSPVITIQPASGDKLEGVVDAQITLESFGAAVSLVWGGSSAGWMVF